MYSRTIQPASHGTLGQQNRRRVLSEILFNGPIPRSAIALHVGLTQAAVSRITRDLIDDELILEESIQPSENRKGGRFINLAVNPEGGYVLGVTIHAFKQVVVLANLKNETIASSTLTPSNLEDTGQVLKTVISEATKLIKTSGIPQERLLGCGVAITGAVDAITGTVLTAPAIHWGEVAIRQVLEEGLELPVFVESIANAINVTEHKFGSTKHLNHVVLINAYLAVGASFLLNGQLFRGDNFLAGIIGNTKLYTGSSYKTTDALTGGYAILEDLNMIDRQEPAIALNDMIALSNQNDEKVSQVFSNAGKHMAILIELIKDILPPEKVLLAGPLIKSKTYMKALSKELSERLGSAWLTSHFSLSELSSEFAAPSIALYAIVAGQDIKFSETRKLVQR